MSTTTLICEDRRAVGLARLRDYAELTKPKICTLSLATVTVGALVAAWGLPNSLVLLNTLLATALLAASACALNQLVERGQDARMNRTSSRPLPAGRLNAQEVMVFGIVGGVVGVVGLALAASWLTASFGLLTWVLYVWVYTPLKSRSTANTVVGAVAGALPVWIGWSAAGGRFGLEAYTLFLIVYLWQFPHFMAIAWLYRRDYAAAGMKMLPVVDPSGTSAARLSVVSAFALLAVSLLPGFWQADSGLYMAGALILGAAYSLAAMRFGRARDDRTARGLLRTSLVYLPGVLGLLTVVTLV